MDKKIEKLGCVIPYQVWDALKNHNPNTIAEVIGVLIEYDYRWLEFQEKGLDGLTKMTPSAAMAVSFAKPLIDANNQKYFAKVYKKDGQDEQAPQSDEAASTQKKTFRYYRRGKK